MVDYQGNTIQILTNLGLPLNQARIYLSTLHSGSVTAKALANTSKIGREDVYRTLASLQEKGLIAKILVTPALFEAIPLKAAIDKLLKDKQQKLSELCREADIFKKNIVDETENKTESDEYKIVYFPKWSCELSAKWVKQTKETIDFTQHYALLIRHWSSPLIEPLWQEYYRALTRGVKVRLVVDMPNTGKQLTGTSFSLKVTNKIVNHKNFQVKYAEYPPEAPIVLYDTNNASIYAKSNYDVAPFIWVNTPSLVSVVKAYFSSIWKTGKESI